MGSPRLKALTNNGKKANWRRRELGLQLHSMEVSSPDKFEEAFRAAAKAQSAAVSVAVPGSVNTANPKTDRGAGGKVSVAGDIRSGRLYRRRVA